MRRQDERPGRRLDAATREEVLDPAEPERLLAGGPRRDPAPERRALERLREVAERQAVGSERRLEGRPCRAAAERREAAPLVEADEARQPVEGDRQASALRRQPA